MLVYTSDSDAQLEASSNNEHDVEASRHIDLSFRARTSFCFAFRSRVMCQATRQGSEALRYEQRPGLDSDCITLTLIRTT